MRSTTHDEVRDSAMAYVQHLHGIRYWATETQIMPFYRKQTGDVRESLGFEICDALGFWSSSCTVTVESKVSKADYLADNKKPWRIDPSNGMGVFRYYAVPKLMLESYEVRDRWGLLYVDLDAEPDGRGNYPTTCVVEPTPFWSRNIAGELDVSILTGSAAHGVDSRKGDNARKDRNKGGALPDRFHADVATVVRNIGPCQAKDIVNAMPALSKWAGSKAKARNALLSASIDGIVTRDECGVQVFELETVKAS